MDLQLGLQSVGLIRRRIWIGALETWENLKYLLTVSLLCNSGYTFVLQFVFATPAAESPGGTLGFRDGNPRGFSGKPKRKEENNKETKIPTEPGFCV